jgi:small subunit ribosomal protein S6
MALFIMARHYELVLMLDPEAEDAARDRVAEDVRKQIEAAGTLERADTWGMRKMAYEIRQRTEADYRYYRFQGEAELLHQLDHNLKIADGALRFRIFKVDPQTPTSPPPATERPAAVGAERRPGREGREGREPREARES